MVKLVKCTPNLGILSFMKSPYLDINGSVMPKNQTIFIVFTLALFWLPILLCILGITQLILIVFFEKKKKENITHGVHHLCFLTWLELNISEHSHFYLKIGFFFSLQTFGTELNQGHPSWSFLTI